MSQAFHDIVWFERFTDLNLNMQRAKKVVSGSQGLVDFAIELVNSVFNLPNGQVMFFLRNSITEELGNQFC